ncbi:LolA family protein [Clostridium estertheticum]|uniref:Outer membrane lipoprotein-sorting protein n=1 Tax=Clostridium estertheticum TaxID=238834 RepID=A0A7Y3WQ20_9CLOT|nr:outer membrane lipoprotein-sorting protein [Clostridium estertheticum]NNU74472.1 outer membrane lipoprotein-sorting protein [Clostridium estertheticum]WBL49025.1 outer membrane lipoprotein-sorting protein [Clostridium estertheticum]
MIKKKIITTLIGLSVVASLFTGCSTKGDVIIPEEVITNVMKANEKSKSYYAEFKMDSYENQKLKESMLFKQWNDNSSGKVKTRIETEDKTSGKVVTTNDGDKLISYTAKDKKAFSMKIGSELALGSNTSYKDQLINQLGNISKTHQLTFKGEETVGNFKTYHISAVAKEKNSIIGDQEYWIEKSNWFLVKSSSESGNNKSIMEYSKLNFSPKIDDSIFVQKLPSDVKVESIEDAAKNNETTIDLKKASKITGKPMLTLKENSTYKLKEVKYLNIEKSKHKEINQIYEKNGALAFTLTTVINGTKVIDSVDENLKIPGEEKITIRGKKGSEMKDIKCISWSENDLNYSILVGNPKITMEDAKKIVEALVATN